MMRDSSEEDTDLSESELEDYIDDVYRQLKHRKYEVKVARNVFKCPFCPGKRSREYNYNDLLQHARGIRQSSKTRDLKDKGNHTALVDFLKKHYGPEVSTREPQERKPGLPRESVRSVEKSSSQSTYDRKEKFVWPWRGIVANLPVQKQKGRFVGESGSKLRDELAKEGFNPLKVIPLWSREGHSGFAIVNFNKDFVGFGNAIAFEKSFEAKKHGRRDFYSSRHPGNELYGWIAREVDYNSSGLIGKHLRDNGDIRSVDEIEDEEARMRESLVSNLTKTIESKDIQCKEIQKKLQETCASLNTVMQEKDSMTQAYNEELQRLQKKTIEDTKKIFRDHEEFTSKLASRKEHLERRESELKKREADYDNEIIELRRLRKMNEMAAVEQKKADENVLKLVEEHKREKEELHKKAIELQKQIDERQALELEIEQLKGASQVMEHMGGDAETKKKMDEINEELKEKEADLEYLESLTQTLIIKERNCNDELQEARKELINGLKDTKATRVNIGVKYMGALDDNVFKKAAKDKYTAKNVSSKADELMSLCRSYIEDPVWHPFRVITEHGVRKAVIKEDDERLQNLKSEMGEEVWQAMMTVMSELNEYNSSGRYPVPELWNFKEGRKASLKEGAEYIVEKWKIQRKSRK